ncbi:ankyrin repeat-containing domain protein [Hypoxylon crocopeplum]|nr:ankyrin repeat-containing domain protein [Hypoxylon crocopeplum]
METLSDEAGTDVKIETGLESNEQEDVVAENGADQPDDVEDESASQAASDTSQESPPLPPPRSNILMICLAGLSTEAPVIRTSSTMDVTAWVRTFSYKPGRFLSERGSMNAMDDIVRELLAFVRASLRDIEFTSSDIGLGFMAADLGGMIVKKALLFAMNDPVYRQIYTKTSLLLFFGTPHQASEQFCWEATTLRIIDDTYRGLRGPWLPDRLQQLCSYLQQVCMDFSAILEKFRIVNYSQDIPGSSSNFLTVHKSCATFQGFNVTNIGLPVTHYELHCFVHECQGEDFIMDRVLDSLAYNDNDFRRLVLWLSLEADGMETSFQTPGCLNNLADCIVQSKGFGPFIYNDQAQVISLEIEAEVDGKRFLPCLRSAIHRDLPLYPHVVFACSSITTTEPSSLTETGLLSCCLVQILKQQPRSSSWLNALSGRILYALRTPNAALRTRTLWECLRLVFSNTSNCRGFWLIHTTSGPKQHQLLLEVLKQLQYFEESDEIGWKIIIVSNSAPHVDFPSSKTLSRVVLDQDTLMHPLEKDVELQLDSIIRRRQLPLDIKERTLQMLRKQRSSHKLLEFFMDNLLYISPPIPTVLASLTATFTSTKAAFCAIFEQVPKHSRTWVRKVLGFICFSSRPLTRVELAIAVGVADCESFEQLQTNIEYGTALYIQNLLPGILRIHEGRIYVVHDELKSFLEQIPDDAWYHLDDFHLEIAMACYKYLSLLLEKFGDVESSPMKTIIGQTRSARAAPGHLRGTRLNQAFGFSPYAASYWYDHYLSARNDKGPSPKPCAWSPEPRFLRDMLCLRNLGKWQWDDDGYDAQDVYPLDLKDASNMNEFDAFEMAAQVNDGQPSNTYVDLMYSPVTSESETTRGWITSNLHELSISEVVAIHPHILNGLLEREKEVVLSNIAQILVSIVGRNESSLLVDFLGKVDGQTNLKETSCKAFSYAVGWGLVDIARTLLGYQVTPLGAFRTTTNGVTLLHTAVATGSLEMVKLLLSAEADVNVLDEDSFLGFEGTPLHVACHLGFEGIVRLLLSKGADVNIANSSRITALHVASSRGFPSICKLLIDHGATITLDSESRSPLHLPARHSRRPRYKKIAILLLETLKKKFPQYKAKYDSDTDDLKDIINAQAGLRKKTALIYAAVAGDVELAKSLIDMGANVDSTEDEDYNAAARAAMMDDVDMVSFLLDNGTEIEGTRADGRQVLHDACAWNSLKVIEELLKRNAPTDHLDNDKVPPIAVAATWNLLATIKEMAPRSSKESISHALVYAARYGYHSVVTALLDAGADINYQDEFGNTPLQFSCWNSNSRVTEILLARIPEINRPDRDNITALADAARRGGIECLKLLLDAGADTEIASTSGKTPLIRAADNDSECFRYLLEHGAERVLPESIAKPASIFKAGLSFLGALAYDFPLEAVKVYLEFLKPRVSEDAFLAEITEALCTAAYSSKLATLQVLLEYNADPNIILTKFDANQGSAIGIAIAWDNIDAVEILLNNKVTPVDLNWVGDYRDTPLHIALDWCLASMKEKMVKLLLSHGADPTISSGTFGTVLNATCEAPDEDVVNLILSQPGVSRDIADDLGRLPLHLAAIRCPYQPRMNLLTTEKSTVKSKDKQGRNALHYAAAAGSVELIEKILVDFPDLVNLPDRDYWTPLHWACRQGSRGAVECLIGHGANEEARTHDRWTPRHVAIYHNMTGYLDLLSEANDENDDDELPSEAAEKVTDDRCDSCFCDIFGTGYRCGTCPKYWFCFKCYWSYEETHPKDHVFQRFDQETHEIETPPGSEPGGGE